MDLIWAGSVESKTCNSGCPGCLPYVIFNTSGHRLEPPMPRSKACVKPALAASVAASFSCFKCASWSSAIGNQPTHLSSSSLVQSEGSPRHRRAVLLPDCQSLSVACTACASGAENSKRGDWIIAFVLTAGLSSDPPPDGAE